MKILIQNSKVEQVLQQIERLLTENGIQIECMGQVFLYANDKRFQYIDSDNGSSGPVTFPRLTESEVFKLVE